MKASLVLAPDTNLAIQRSNLDIKDLDLRSDLGWQLSAQSFLVALARQDADQTRYEFALQGLGVAPPKIASPLPLPDRMSALEIDATLGFDRPWDLRALNDRRPQPNVIQIRNAKAQWGPMLLQAVGDMTTDEAGYLQGELTLRATQWQAILQIARDSGQIQPFILDGLEPALRVFASLSGSEDDIDVTLKFEDRRTRFGILTLAPAPRLILR